MRILRHTVAKVFLALATAAIGETVTTTDGTANNVPTLSSGASIVTSPHLGFRQ
jgi:hypothetical protein